MAAVYDRMLTKCEVAGLAGWRRDLLAPLTGTVAEIGAGTGLNLRHYPATVERLVLVEPDPHMRRRLVPKVAEAGHAFPVEVVDSGAERLPFTDGEVDVVVSTLVLCSVPDHRAALAEAHRVLRPGGRLAYLEHVAAVENPKRHTWQRRLEPVQKLVAGNCHLTRTTDQDILAAGFEPEEERRESMRGAPPMVRVTVRGHARKAVT